MWFDAQKECGKWHLRFTLVVSFLIAFHNDYDFTMSIKEADVLLRIGVQKLLVEISWIPL